MKMSSLLYPGVLQTIRGQRRPLGKTIPAAEKEVRRPGKKSTLRQHNNDLKESLQEKTELITEKESFIESLIFQLTRMEKRIDKAEGSLATTEKKTARRWRETEKDRRGDHRAQDPAAGPEPPTGSPASGRAPEVQRAEAEESGKEEKDDNLRL